MCSLQLFFSVFESIIQSSLKFNFLAVCSVCVLEGADWLASDAAAPGVDGNDVQCPSQGFHDVRMSKTNAPD
jgi:hypothetical protein